MPEHNLPLTKERLAERHAICATSGVTLNGEPAAIIGAKRPFPYVIQVKSGLIAEWSWESVKHVLAECDGRFKS